jgi:signal transduction histidine kinase
MSRSQPPRSKPLLLPVWLVGTTLLMMVLLVAAVATRAVSAGLDHDVDLASRLLVEASPDASLFTNRRVLAAKFDALRGYSSVERACLYDQQGSLAARHSKDPASRCPEDRSALDASTPTPARQVPILWQGEPIGQLYVYVKRAAVVSGVLRIVAPIAALALLLWLIVTVVGRRLVMRSALPLRALTASSRELIQEDRQAEQRTQAALTAAESLLRKIIDLVPYLIFAVRANGSVIFANRAVADAYGVPIDALLDGRFADQRGSDRPDGLLFEDHRTRQPPTEIWFNDCTGHIKRFLVTRVPFVEQQDAIALPTSELVVAVDVTEERRLQMQLQFSQRLEVVGTLAGGIAHDFNNLLTPIMGYSTLLMDRDLPADVATKLKAIYSAALKARDLVQQILTFSRHQNEAAEKQQVDAASVLEDAIGLMRSTIPSSIEIKVDVAPNLPLINANPGQLHQVIVNLCTNAAQAIQKSRGHVGIKLRRADPTQPGCPSRVASGDFIELSVTDDGAGMTADVRARIFEPFFTTKDVGQGSGLGLSVVHGIVTGHGGDITVTTNAGAGSTFRVYLPAVEHAADRVEMPTPQRAEGHERILLIDDEVAVARATKDLLENLGYEVEAFTQPASALRQFQQPGRAFDVIVTDNLMPDMTGLELADAIRASDPSIPIVLMSGYVDDKADHNPAITVTISKPTSGRELSNLIQQVIHKQVG